MATPATLAPNAATAGGTAQGTTSAAGNVPVAVVPFVRASQLHRESAGFDLSRQLTTSDQDLGVASIPAYGFLRGLILDVQATGGAGAGVAAGEDAPFSVLKNIVFQEPNGATITQFNSGFNLYIANKYGGYRGNQDPKASPVYSPVAATGGGFAFQLRIPIELLERDGLGALPNQNAAATFQLRLTLSSGAANAGLYGGTVPTTQPTVRVRVYAEEWDQPETSTEGAMNSTMPPAMNTTQYWSEQQFAVGAGQFSTRLTRLGNYLRNLIFIYKVTGTRAAGETNWPEITLAWDTRPLDLIPRNVWKQQMYERYGYGAAVGTVFPALDAPGGLDNGVYAYDFCHEFDGKVGNENRDLWLPTLGSTRLEVVGNFPAAGTLTVLTNDVSTAGNVFL